MKPNSEKQTHKVLRVCAVAAVVGVLLVKVLGAVSDAGVEVFKKYKLIPKA